MSADIHYYQNNGVLAIKPVPGSRLDKLVCIAQHECMDLHEEEQMWVFADNTCWEDEHGNRRVDHRRRGVMCGTYDEGQKFLDECRRLGLRVEQHGFFVPFSNGQRRYGTFADGEPCTDYLESELRLARYDLPDCGVLSKFVERYARPELTPRW